MPASPACYTILYRTPVRNEWIKNEKYSFCAVKEHSQHTIGVEFSSRTIKVGEKRIKLQVCGDETALLQSVDLPYSSLCQLWDTAGQERFRYSGCSGNSGVFEPELTLALGPSQEATIEVLPVPC